MNAAPQLPERPLSPDVPPRAPELPLSPGVPPQAPEAPQPPGVPDLADVPRSPESPGVPPQASGVPAAREVPGVAQVRAVPGVPHVPQASEVSAAPDVPDVPDVPQVPEVAEASKVPEVPEVPEASDGRPPAFEVKLANFEGPFDLLLTLISKHQLDVTEVALSRVTDEFIAHIRALGSSWDLGQATEFLVVAATLLDLKAARLLPSAEVEDEEDLALLEARDLLFARLLQYRAYKLAAAHLQTLERASARRFPRAVSLDPRFAELMPELLLTISPEKLARIAAEALRPKPPPVVSTAHIYAARVSVREHAMVLRERLSRSGQSTFRTLTQDCEHTVEMVARFLALLELYREGAVAFDQVTPLGELWVRWTGAVGTDEPAEDENMDEEYG